MAERPRKQLGPGIGLRELREVLLALAKWHARAQALAAAYEANPERFPNGRPMPPKLPTQAWINQPADNTIETDAQPAAVH